MRHSLILALIVAALVYSGCRQEPGDHEGKLIVGAEVELLSVHPDDRTPDTDNTELIDRWPVLGSIMLSADERGQVVTELEQCIANSDGSLASCFEPRHAIRSKVGTITHTYLICFECAQIYHMVDGDWQPPAGHDQLETELGPSEESHVAEIIPITAQASGTLNALLTKHGVPLAPSP